MLTGMDVFTTQVVALRHKGPLRPEVKTLAEILRAEGYNTTCVGFSGNPARAASTSTSTSRLGQLERGAQPQGRRT